MRGKGLSNRPECPISGITPAYAGKRATLASVVGMAMDHPRLCGEKRQWQTASRTEAGSPPPMRGKGYRGYFFSSVFRITPAYAGKSLSLKSPIPEIVDHPRLCGEKRLLTVWTWILRGSPPPMRGKVNRLIQSGGCAEDHPRLCGEKVELPVFVFVLLGSPPPMRGKGSKRSGTTSKHRITPAYAGKRFFVIMPNRGC